MDYLRQDYRGILNSHEKRSKAATDPFLPEHIKKKIPMFEDAKRQQYEPETYKLRRHQSQLVPEDIDEIDKEEQAREIDRQFEKVLGGKSFK